MAVVKEKKRERLLVSHQEHLRHLMPPMMVCTAAEKLKRNLPHLCDQHLLLVRQSSSRCLQACSQSAVQILKP